MTPREQDAVIAEWCEPMPTEEVGRQISPCDWESVGGFWLITMYAPDHLSDWKPKQLSSSRDLMALAEKVVREQRLTGHYQRALMDVVAQEPLPDDVWYDWLTLTATAPQRAEAMVRVIQSFIEAKRC